MNRPDRKSPAPKARPRPWAGVAASAAQLKAVRASRACAMPTPNVKRPVAPKVYIPKPKQAVAQLKPSARTLTPAGSAGRKQPIAVPPFRPLPPPICVQAKFDKSIAVRKQTAQRTSDRPAYVPTAVQTKNTVQLPAPNRGRVLNPNFGSNASGHDCPDRSRTLQMKGIRVPEATSSIPTPPSYRNSHIFSRPTSAKATAAAQQKMPVRPMVIQRSTMSAQEAMKYAKAEMEEIELAKKDVARENEIAEESESKRFARVAQQSRQSCGLAAVRMVVYAQLNYEVTEKEMAEWLNINPNYLGTQPDDLTALLKSFHVPNVKTLTDAILTPQTCKLLKDKVGSGPIICGIAHHWIVIDSIDVTPGKVTNAKLGLYEPDQYTFTGRDPWGYGQSFPPKGDEFKCNVQQMRTLGASEYIYINK